MRGNLGAHPWGVKRTFISSLPRSTRRAVPPASSGLSPTLPGSSPGITVVRCLIEGRQFGRKRRSELFAGSVMGGIARPDGFDGKNDEHVGGAKLMVDHRAVADIG